MSALARKWSRRRWIAEAFGTNLSDLDEYQPSSKVGRLPIFDDGTLNVCVLPGDSEAKVAATLVGRQWSRTEHWADHRVVIYVETRGKA